MMSENPPNTRMLTNTPAGSVWRMLSTIIPIKRPKPIDKINRPIFRAPFDSPSFSSKILAVLPLLMRAILSVCRVLKKVTINTIKVIKRPIVAIISDAIIC